MTSVDIAFVIDLHRQGKLDEAERGYRFLIDENKASGAVYSNLAAICRNSGRQKESDQLLRLAIANDPEYADAYFNLGLSLKEQGKLDETEAVLRQAITCAPLDYRSHHLLALTLRDRDDVSNAILSLQRAIEINPESHRQYTDLGIMFTSQGRDREAIESFKRAADYQPDNFAKYVDLGLALRRIGESEAAEISARKAVMLMPTAARAHHLLALVLKDRGLLADSASALRHAIALEPTSHLAYYDFGEVLLDLNRIEEAIVAYRQAIALEPRNPRPFASLGFVLRDRGELDETIACFRKIVALRPQDSSAHINLGIMLADQARVEEAAACFQQAIALKPDDPHAHSSLIFHLAYTQLLPAGEFLKIARRFELECCPQQSDSTLKTRPIVRHRKIRIGFHSAEIGDHAVAYFLESYLRNYDRDKFEVFIYAAKTRRDAKRMEMASLVDAVQDLADLGDDDARRQIIADNIDILIDTTGHTARGRLRMLSRRCAPIQCFYIGFVATTGVSAIDYFIGDEETIPAAFESHFSEKIVRLPRLWGAYTPPADTPVPEQLSPDDEITFGSFNNLIKVREDTLSLWASILIAIPKSRLVLKDWKCADPSTRNRIAAFLEHRGIRRERIEFVGKTLRWADHMQLYNRIDIALDTIPFNSCTTGFDAVFMSTPLVALRGNWMGGRMSSSLLKALGRPEWIADTPEEYAKIAIDLASDRPRLKNYKRTLRDEVINSPLCDAKSLARDLEAAFVRMIDEHNRGADAIGPGTWS